MKPSDDLRSLKPVKARYRIDYCVVMLHLHGFSSDAENAAIKRRVRKWIDKEAANQPPTEIEGR